MRIAVPDTKLVIPRPPEYKALSFRVKAVDDQRYIIEGILNAIGNIDDGDDRTMPNAFKKTLNDSYSRKSAQHLDFLWPYLWNHDPSEPPIGGIFDGDEVKAQGDMPAGLFIKVQLIPDIERARNVYSCFKSQSEGDTKSSGLLRQSMGYKTIRSEYVPEKIDGQVKQIRNLLEVQVWEGSAVVFPMNEMAVVTSVKSGDERTQRSYFVMPEIEHKTVCGDTSLPIGPRDESWDGAAAKKQIFDWAEKEDGTIDAGKAKKCFLQVDGDTSLKGSYGYPFCYVHGGSPTISVGGVKACAGALSGSRGASTDGSDIAGMRAKVATMYRRISEKYKDDPELTPPWNEKDKASDKPVDKKTFAEHYAEEMCEDLLEDLGEVWFCSLQKAIIDAFKIGDMPANDINEALTDFHSRFLKDWVTQAQEFGLSDYLASADMDSPLSPYAGGNGYGWMSRHDKPEGKAGARFSANSKQTLQDHADALRQMATEHKTLSDQLAMQQKSMMKSMQQGMMDHANMLEQKASDLTQLWQSEGQGDAYAQDDINNGSNTGKSNTQTNSTKRREPSTETLTRESDPQPRTLTEEEELKALEAALAGWMKK